MPFVVVEHSCVIKQRERINEGGFFVKTKRLGLSLVMSLTVALCLAPCAFSLGIDTVTLTNTQYANGTGFGNVINVLSLQQKGNATVEAGSVIPTSVAVGDAKPNSKTWTSAQLTGLGLTAANLGIVFNPAQPGSSDVLNLLSFSVDFYNGNGEHQGSAPLTNPKNGIVPLTTGTGTSGWLMVYNNDAGVTLIDQFFANSSWVLGATGSLSAVSGGQDNFYLVNTTVPPPPPAVPEPTTLLLFGLGLVGLAGIRRMRQ